MSATHRRTADRARTCSWSRTSPAGSASIALPHLDAGPFLSYGIQWIAFGIIAPIGLGYFAYSEIRRPQTGSRGEQPRGRRSAPVTVEDKLADRYGRRR